MVCLLYRKIIYIAGELKRNATQDYVRLYIRISDLILLYDNNYLFSREWEVWNWTLHFISSRALKMSSSISVCIK